MDEAGQPGSTTPGDSGDSAGPRGDGARRTGGWSAADAAWSDEATPGGDVGHPPWHQPAARDWSEPPRYHDLHRAGRDPRQPVNGVNHPPHADETAPITTRAPASAPPYPYEGDLEDAARQRPAIPAPRPDSPPEAQADEAPPPDPAEHARHAIGGPTPAEGLPAIPSRWQPTGWSESPSPGYGDPDEPMPYGGTGYRPPATHDQPTGDRPGPDSHFGGRPPSSAHYGDDRTAATHYGAGASRFGDRAGPRFGDQVAASHFGDQAAASHFGDQVAESHFGDRTRPRDPAGPDRYAGPGTPRDADQFGPTEAERPGPAGEPAAGVEPQADVQRVAGGGRSASAQRQTGDEGPAGAESQRFEPTPAERGDWEPDGPSVFGRRVEPQARPASWRPAAAAPPVGRRAEPDPGRRAELDPPGTRRAEPESPSTRRAELESPGARRVELDSPGARRAEPDPPVGRRVDLDSSGVRRIEPEQPAGTRRDEPGPFAGLRRPVGSSDRPTEPEPYPTGRAEEPAEQTADRRTRSEWAPTLPAAWRSGPAEAEEPARAFRPGQPDPVGRFSGDAGGAGESEPARQDERADFRPANDRSAARPWSSDWATRPPTRPSAQPSPEPATTAFDSAGARGDRIAVPAQPRLFAPNPAGSARQPEPVAEALPKRVPAEPDVPIVPELQAGQLLPAETPELARIATALRRDNRPPESHEPPEEFDVEAILAAVLEVTGVRDAALRTTPAGAHSLRLDLHDGADPAEVSRLVARLLQDRMGLAAAPQNLPGAAPTEMPPPPEPIAEVGPEVPRRRRPAGHRGRATVDDARTPRFPEPGVAAGVIGSVGGHPVAATGRMTGEAVTAGTSYQGGQITTTESAPSRPLDPGDTPGPRVVLDHVQVSTFGLDATVEVRLAAGPQHAAGLATGPAVDGYVLRLCAVSAALAIDELLRTSDKVTGRGRCFVEHTAVVPFGSCEVAVVVVLLVCDGWVEQLAGSALVSGDPRQAVVRATLAAVNRRLEALLSTGS